ncbi:MAG: F0F1 ATP synthase subunit A [Steroidobacteraceae bacterium]
MAEHEVPSFGEYIRHHITFLANKEQTAIVDFSVVHWDSVFWSVFLALVFIGVFYSVGRKATAGVPGKLQNFIEMMVEFVDGQVRETYHGTSKLIAPLALTIFCWVLLFNMMDWLPVDLMSTLTEPMGFEHMKVVPSTDLNITFGMSITVFLLVIFYSFKIKGAKSFISEFTLHPFHFSNPFVQALFIPINFVLEFVPFMARPVSLALRLYGNLFAGEVVFLLIALFTLKLGLENFPVVGGALAVFAHVMLGTIWAAFHVIVIPLQAFIFMKLTIIYMSMASEKAH